MQQPKRLPTASPIERARDQAEAYDSLFASTPMELNDGSVLMIPPHPDFGMLDDDRMEDYEDLLMEVETYDRDSEIFIPEQKLEGGVTLPAETRKGELLRPYRKNGVRVKPSHTVRVVQAALGPEDYARLRAGGKNAADVWKVWGKQGLAIQERRLFDPKSDGSSVDLESISTPDSE
jgi:hypothetical protein